jgi:hypothetical protein
VRGGGIGKAEQGMVRMDCARRGNRKGRTWNGNDRTRNGSLPLTALISSRDCVDAGRRASHRGSWGSAGRNC